MRDASSELAVAALRSLLQVAGASPQAFAAQYRSRTGWLQNFLAHTDGSGALQCLPCADMPTTYLLCM